MAVLAPKYAYGNANLTSWLSSLENMLWADRSWNDAFLYSEGAGCFHAERRRYAYPALVFSGRTHGATGKVVSTLVTANNKSIYFSFVVHSVVTNAAIIGQNEAIFTTSAGASAGFGVFLKNNAGTYEIYGANYDAGGWKVTPVQTIQLDTWYVACLWHSGAATLRLKLNAETTYTGVATTATTNVAGNLVVGRNAQASPNTKYFDGEVGEFITRNVADNVGVGEVHFAYLLSQWGARGDAVEIARAEGSRRIFDLGQPPLMPEIMTKRVDLLDLNLGDSVAVECDRYPHRDGAAGALGETQDQRAELRLTRMVLDGDTMTLRATGIDRRLRDCCSFMRFDPPSSVGSWNDGPLLLLPNGASFRPYAAQSSPGMAMRTARRASDGLYVPVHPGQWPLEADGLLVEGQFAGMTYHTMFYSGDTGWTRSSGGGGATPAAVDTSGVFCFDSALTTKNMRIAQDSPVTREKTVANTTAWPIGAGHDAVVSIIYRNGSQADLLVWRLVRASDGKYWNDTTGAWVVGDPGNQLAASGADPTLFTSKIVTAPAGATTYTLTVASVASGTAGRIDDIYYIACEEGQHAATNPARALATAISRHSTWELVSVAADGPVVARTRGTTLMAFKPGPRGFGLACGIGYGPRLWKCYQGTELQWVYYNGTTQQFVLVDEAAHVSTVLVSLASLLDGNHHWVAARYAGPTGDEDLAAGMFQVVADGVSGSVAAYAGFDDVTEQLMYFSDGIVGFGWLRAMQSFPRVLSLAECTAWGRRHCR